MHLLQRARIVGAYLRNRPDLLQEILRNELDEDLLSREQLMSDLSSENEALNADVANLEQRIADLEKKHQAVKELHAAQRKQLDSWRSQYEELRATVEALS